jgi:hypothetical protein
MLHHKSCETIGYGNPVKGVIDLGMGMFARQHSFYNKIPYRTMLCKLSQTDDSPGNGMIRPVNRCIFLKQG